MSAPTYTGEDRPKWRLFQLAFLLLNLPAIARDDSADRDTVELIFFPTGGGKTEAYLGVIAFTLILRRLRGNVRPDHGLGVAVLLRYTLRLLTLDQLGRAATLVCALEMIRREQPTRLGDVRFAVGLWVGRSATANTMTEASERLTEYKTSSAKNPSSPFPLTHCPWCRAKLGPDSFTLRPSKKSPTEVVAGCLDPTCDFNPNRHPEGLPVLFVDEQIYRELPAFVIATVDKFAMLPWRGEAGMLFGRVLARQGRAFVGPLDALPSGAEKLPTGLLPPELIVQDELHLISGPLGTMVGLYETAVEALCTRTEGDRRIRPKILASTATVRRARDQIQALMGRQTTALFPPPGPNDSETFFANVDRQGPGRLYIGIAAPGRAMKAITLRTYVALLAAAQKLYDTADKDATDAYMTLVGYFNSLRELGGMRRLVEDDVRRRPSAVQTIELRPLSELSVSQVVADTLRCEPADSRGLAAMVSAKTHGNPFFVNELLGMLYREGAFPFLSAEGRWDWDAAKVESLQVSDDVVDLMVQRIGRLSPRAIEYLRQAACLGSRFDLSTLTRTVDMPAGTIAGALREAIQERILFPIGSAYRLVQDHLIYDDDELDKLGVEYQFQHDRVWQAAYSMLTDWERSRIHLTIGRLTRSAEPPTAERAALFFERLNHLNLGRSLITSAEDRAELAELNFVAGQRAKRSAAYAIAASYLEKSMDLLSTEEAAADPGRRFECRHGRVECLFLAGEVERASDLCDELHAHAHDKVSLGAVFYLKAGILEHQGRLSEAVGTIRAGLACLGVELPSEQGELQRRVGEGIATMQAHLARRRIEDFVHLPEMTNQEKIMITNLLFQLVPSAIQTNLPLFVLTEVIMFDLALTHGVSAASCKNFVDCGIIQGGILGDYEGAFRLGKVALRLLERYLPTQLEPSVHFVFATYVSHWRSDYEEGFTSFARALRAGLEMGDVRHVCYTRVHRAHRMFLVGRNLDECHAETENAARHLTEVRAVGPLAGIGILRRALAPLRGTTAEPGDAQMSDERFTELLLTTGNAQALYTHGQMQAMVSFFLGDLAASAKWVAYAAPSVAVAAGLFSLPDYHLFQGLILAQRVKDAGHEERPALLERIGGIVERLGKWAGHSPRNFAHKLALAQAELARVRGAPLEEVIPLYDEALRAAGDGFLSIRALVHELEAQLWAERGQLDLARTHLQEAYDLYRSWGAQAKLRRLERRHPDWLSARVPSDEAAALSPTPDYRDDPPS